MSAPLPPLPATLCPNARNRLLTDATNPNYGEDLHMLVLAGLVPASGRTAVPRRRQQLMIGQWLDTGRLGRGTLCELWLICEGEGETLA